MARRRDVRCCLVLLAGFAASPTVAQERGSGAAAVAGGALGFFSGSLLGVAGSLIPCTQTMDGSTCILAHALGGGWLGMVGGALGGGRDTDWVKSAGISAGIGFLAGSTAGLVLKPMAQRFGWHDVFTIGLLGGAIGASPEGAALGFGAGALAGVVAWKALPGGTFPDALAAALAGTAIGGIGGWLIGGIGREGGSGVPIHLGQIRF